VGPGTDLLALAPPLEHLLPLGDLRLQIGLGVRSSTIASLGLALALSRGFVAFFFVSLLALFVQAVFTESCLRLSPEGQYL